MESQTTGGGSDNGLPFPRSPFGGGGLRTKEARRGGGPSRAASQEVRKEVLLSALAATDLTKQKLESKAEAVKDQLKAYLGGLPKLDGLGCTVDSVQAAPEVKRGKMFLPRTHAKR